MQASCRLPGPVMSRKSRRQPGGMCCLMVMRDGSAGNSHQSGWCSRPPVPTHCSPHQPYGRSMEAGPAVVVAPAAAAAAAVAAQITVAAAVAAQVTVAAAVAAQITVAAAVAAQVTVAAAAITAQITVAAVEQQQQ